MKLYDALEKKDFEDIDIGDSEYDCMVAFSLDIENADNDTYDTFLSKLAKTLDVVQEYNDYIIVNLTKFVRENFDLLDEIFDVNAETKEDEVEELVMAMPEIISGYCSQSVYDRLSNEIV